MQEPIHVKINGALKTYPKAFSLSELLSQLRVSPQQVAVAKNLNVIIRGELSSTFIENGDEIEIFHAVGGG